MTYLRPLLVFIDTYEPCCIVLYRCTCVSVLNKQISSSYCFFSLFTLSFVNNLYFHSQQKSHLPICYTHKAQPVDSHVTYLLVNCLFLPLQRRKLRSQELYKIDHWLFHSSIWVIITKHTTYVVSLSRWSIKSMLPFFFCICH